MSPQSTAYALGGTLTEQQRLIAQAQGLEEHAKWLLDGVVIGVEREQRFFDMAQAELDNRRLQNVKLVQADALHTGLERNFYDFVHERLLLINFPAASQHALLSSDATPTSGKKAST
jgi:ubiquinone/menaquinone biosynthesis C-methylase UbiE